MSLLQLITLVFLVVVDFFFGKEFNLTQLYYHISHTRKIHENNQSQGLKWPKFSLPPPLSLSLSFLPSLPVSLKRGLFHSVIPREKNIWKS